MPVKKGGAGVGVSDHGALTGLLDDDHIQYLLRSLLTTRGDIFYRDAAGIARLGAGEQHKILAIDTDPIWRYRNVPYYDRLIMPEDGDYIAIDKNGIKQEDDSDYGAVFNNCLADMNHEGVLAHKGSETYVPTTQPLVTGTGSPLEKQLEITTIGGKWAIIDAPSGIDCIRMERGVNLLLHKMHLVPHTSGGGKAIGGLETAGQNAYLENCAWLARLGNLKMEGGTSGQFLVELELSEWVELFGLIYLDGAAGVSGWRFKSSDTAQFAYGENLISGILVISVNGSTCVGLEMLGTSTKPFNLFHSKGKVWIRQDAGGSVDDIGYKATYMVGCDIEGLHIENFNTILQLNTGCKKNILQSGFQTTTMGGAFDADHDPRGIAFDVNAGTYANTIKEWYILGGSIQTKWVDDEQNDGNAPNRYKDIVLELTTGGEFLQDFQANTIRESLPPNSKPYRRLGSGTFP